MAIYLGTEPQVRSICDNVRPDRQSKCIRFFFFLAPASLVWNVLTLTRLNSTFVQCHFPKACGKAGT